MINESYKEKLRRKYELATSEQYKSLREEALDYIVQLSGNEQMKDYTQGMLLLIKFFDSFISDYETAVANEKEE